MEISMGMLSNDRLHPELTLLLTIFRLALSSRAVMNLEKCWGTFALCIVLIQTTLDLSLTLSVVSVLILNISIIPASVDSHYNGTSVFVVFQVVGIKGISITLRSLNPLPISLTKVLVYLLSSKLSSSFRHLHVSWTSVVLSLLASSRITLYGLRNKPILFVRLFLIW